jgi:hypothetical protein
LYIYTIMYKLQETSVEWALLHVMNYYDSDFFPRLFEFDAIKRDWTNIKAAILNIDLEKYAPKNPFIFLALKPNGNYRVVHQLDPLDSIIYTALLNEDASIIETYRIPSERKISCSYRIKLDTTGSFFERDHNGYSDFLEKAEELADENKDGVVLICDIVDFYNQIYLHRVNNVLSEAGSKAGKIIESFLGGLNTNVSRGIPVGPAPSILIAEAIMNDVNKKIIGYTSSFSQYVDDLYIFFKNEYDAKMFLHELTRYLYSIHRLVLSPDKTQIVKIPTFKNDYLKEDARREKQAILDKLEELNEGMYSSVEEIDFDELDPPDKFKIRSEAYSDLFTEALKFNKIDLGLMRHILRQAGKYKVRKIINQIFTHFDQLLPVIREVIIYFERVLNEDTVKRHESQFAAILENPYLKLPFINMWVFTLFQNDLFNLTSIKIDYNQIFRIRETALIAKREKNLTWLKDIKDGLDTLGVWDRRAVIYSSIALSEDEVIHWLGLESSKGDIINKAICSMIISDKKASK